MIETSKYNCIHKTDSHIIIFNSLSKKILIVDKEQDLLEYKNTTRDNQHVQTVLLENHFLTNTEIDETSVARMNRLDEAFSNILNLTILPTTLCNFQCVYCYEQLSPCLMDEQMRARIELFLKRQIPHFHSVHIDWFGGEPLLMKQTIYDISKSIETACRKSGTRLSGSITTNGYLLDLETFQTLLSHRVNTFSITIDGPSFIHDHMRKCKDGSGSFDTIITNLLEIKNKIKSRHFLIIIKVNVTRPLLKVFNEFLQYLNNTFEQDPRFTFMFRSVADYGGDDIETIREDLLSEHDIVYDYLLQSNISLDYRAYYSLLTNQACVATKRHAYIINADGAVCKCLSLLTAERSQIGRIGENGELLLDRAKLSQWISNNYAPNSCEICKFAPTCNNCPAKDIVMGNKRPCIMENGNLGKILELLTNDYKKNKYGFVYELKKGVLIQC